MTKFNYKILAPVTAMMAVFALPALAEDVMVASAMQRCSSNQECQLVTNSCNDNCGFVPINAANLAAVQSLYQSRCGKPMGSNVQCTTNPPLAAACINSRCTIDYPYANHAGPKDYQSGTYPVPEKAEASKVQGDYQGVNDRGGNFTAYNLPQNAVRQDTMGQLTTTVYVPPSAPVSGGNYVPVGQAPQAAPAAQPQAVPAPANIPPAAVPADRLNATPPVVTQGAPVYPAAPQPTAPAQQPIAPGQTYVPAETAPTIPAPGLPPTSQQVPRGPGPAPIAAVGAPGVPQAPPGATPIPPSDLKPAPTFVPPPGTPVRVAPDDPGAPPPAGTLVEMPTEDGGSVIVGGTKAQDAQKSFSKSAKKSEYN